MMYSQLSNAECDGVVPLRGEFIKSVKTDVLINAFDVFDVSFFECFY